MSLVSDIKLIRTDTTLDLSQKAEKGILLRWTTSFLYYSPSKTYRKPYGTMLLWDGMPRTCLPHVDEMRLREIHRGRL
jgi:hypothetical protein